MIPEHYVIEGRGNPKKLLMLIHGYDANEYHLASLGPLMDPNEECLIVAPRAPIKISERGVSWYNKENKGEVADQLNGLDELISSLCNSNNIDRAETIVGGFSQGAGLAIGLSFINNGLSPIKLCIPICGFLPPLEELDIDWQRAKATNYLAQFGTKDPYISSERMTEMVNYFKEKALSLTVETYNMGHDNTIESIQGIQKFI
jgi:predicted esterase